MAFPAYVNTRTVSVGGSGALTDADARNTLQVTVTASRRMKWNANGGYRFERFERTYTGDPGAELQIDLPVTDQQGWRDMDSDKIIDVTAPGSYTHKYTVTVVTLTAEGRYTRTQPDTIGPFPLPTGDGSVVDLDQLVPASTVAGEAVSVPDAWGATVQRAEDIIAATGVSVTAFPDPANPDLLILSYPSFLLADDGTSVALSIGA